MILLNIHDSSYFINIDNKDNRELDAGLLIDKDSTILVNNLKFLKINFLNTCVFLFEVDNSDFILRNTIIEYNF